MLSERKSKCEWERKGFKMLAPTRTKDCFIRAIVLAALLLVAHKSTNFQVKGAPQQTASQSEDTQKDGSSSADESNQSAVVRVLQPLITDPNRAAHYESAVDDAERETFFSVDARLDELRGMDCHFRNIDYCLSGLLGSMAKGLPEDDEAFEVKCDEIKAATHCLRVYMEKCGSERLMALLAPFGIMERKKPTEILAKVLQVQGVNLQDAGDVPIDPKVESLLLNTSPEEAKNQSLAPVRYRTLMELCDPAGKKDPANKRVRQQLFKLGKCLNERIPFAVPCLSDLKNAFLIFYEPKRRLPREPTCCAISRFQSCMTSAFDKVCGTNSIAALMEQLETTFLPMRAIERYCGAGLDHNSQYCKDTLPPVGMKTPIPKKDNRMSRIAKALDLITMVSPKATIM